MSDKFIEWDVPQPALRERLVVERRGNGVDEAVPRRGATLEDLRKACEAVGLHVATQEENTERAEKAERMATALAEVRSQLEQAEADTGIGLCVLVATYIAACKDLGVNLGNLCLGVDRALGASGSEVATLRAQLDEGSKALLEAGCGSAKPIAERVQLLVDERHGMRADIAQLRAQLAASEARITKAEQETEIPLDTLTWSYVEACKSTCVSRGDLQEGIDDLRERAETAEAANATLTARLDAAEKALAEAGWVARTSPEGRATDEELRIIYAKAETAAEGVAAVSARVRRERGEGLVERLVAKAVDFEVTEEGGGYWTVCTRTPDGQPSYRTTSNAVPAANVPATLARLAGLEEK